MKVTIKGVGEFSLVNDGKLGRVLDGTSSSDGSLLKGLGKDADHGAIIAAYDKIAGLITGKEGANVKIGCFYDFENKKAFDKPEVIYVFRVGKKSVEVKAGDAVPLEAQAVEAVKKEEVKELKKKAKTKKK